MQNPTYVIAKDDLAVNKKSLKRLVSKLPSPGLKPEDVFEAPFQTLRRVLGENFHELADNDEIFVRAFPMMDFSESEAIKQTEVVGVVINCLCSIWDGFMLLADGVVANITPEFAAQPKMKCALTTLDGAIINTLSLDDLKPCLYYENGVPKEIYRNKDIAGLIKNIESVIESLKNGSLPQDTINSLTKSLNSYQEQLHVIYNELIHNFFEVIKAKFGVDDVQLNNDNIVDFTVWFGIQTEIPTHDGTGKRTVIHTEVTQVHNNSYVNLGGIKNVLMV